MIRGTTPTLEFVLPFDTNKIMDAYISIAQQGEVKIDKQLSECACNGNVLALKLTQEETLQLRSDCIAEIQIRAKMNGGDAIASNIIRVSALRILKDGVI